MKNFNIGSIVSVLAVFAVFGLAGPISALAATAPTLGLAGDYAVLSKAQITDVNSSVITGDVGASPITGASIHLSCSEVTGTIWQVDDAYTGGFNTNTTCATSGTANGNAGKTHVDTAVGNMGTAYAVAVDVTANPAGIGTFLNVGKGTLGDSVSASQHFVPGVYTWNAGVTIPNDIYLDGSATDVWVFQISGTLDTSHGVTVHLTGGALAKNVFWAVTGNVSLGTASVFEGNVLTTGTSNITLLTGATLHGRALSDGEIALQQATITVPSASNPAPTIQACNGSSFDSFALGSVNNQNGWSATGPFDQAIVDNTYGYSSFGCKSLRISDSVTSGSFGDQVFTPSITNEAGEADANNDGMSGGSRQTHFDAQFDLASIMPTLQSGMHVSVSPDLGDGSRMSYLRFEDSVNGINVFFDDVQGTTNPANFVETQIATGLSRTTPHTIKFAMDFVNGPSNDIVQIYIDNVLVHTGTSWENYFRYDTEATQNNVSLENKSRTVDSLLFRESGTATPADAGNGFLLDNFLLSSSASAPVTNIQTTTTVSGGQASSTLPVGVTQTGSDNNGGTVTADIPSGTVITGNSTWNGVISAPTPPATTQTVTVAGFDTTVTSAFTVGSAESDLTFDKAVKLTFAGQSGQHVGWYNNAGIFTEITDTCAANDQVTGDALAAGTSCKIDVGSDLVVWTKHFSTFVTYTQTTAPAPTPAPVIVGGIGGGRGNISSLLAPSLTPAVGQVLGAYTVSPAIQAQINSIKAQLITLIEQLITMLQAQLVVAQAAAH